MIFDAGITNVSTAGTEQQLSNTDNRVLWIRVKALAGNSNKIYFGDSSVSSSNGYELSAGNELEIDFKASGGTVAFKTLYVDSAANNDKLSWIVTLEG